MNKKVLILSLCLLAIASVVMWPVFRARKLNRQFESITKADDRSAVIWKIGKPWKDGECGVYFGAKPHGCGEEFIYAHPYAPILPEYWIIDFDSTHHVINAVHLVSP